MKKTTRDHDLADLEQHRDNAPDREAYRQRTALLELVYQQAKDPTLEKMRLRLQDALKHGDMKAVNEIRKKVQAYASQKSFVEKMYGKMRQASQKRAEIYVAKK